MNQGDAHGKTSNLFHKAIMALRYLLSILFLLTVFLFLVVSSSMYDSGGLKSVLATTILALFPFSIFVLVFPKFDKIIEKYVKDFGLVKRVIVAIKMVFVIFVLLVMTFVLVPETSCAKNNYGKCLDTKPLFCNNDGALVNKSSECGCPENYSVNGDSCVFKCIDGTLENKCSTTKPKYCTKSGLIDKASICGCSTGYSANGPSCAYLCQDGTRENECSANKPQYCTKNGLINKADVCGCQDGFNSNGSECNKQSEQQIASNPTNTTSVPVQAPPPATNICPSQGFLESDVDYCVDLCLVGKSDAQVNSDTCTTICEKLDYYGGSSSLKKQIQNYKCKKCGDCTGG